MELEEDPFDLMDTSFQAIIKDVLRDCTGILEEALRFHHIFDLDDLIMMEESKINNMTMIRDYRRT